MGQVGIHGFGASILPPRMRISWNFGVFFTLHAKMLARMWVWGRLGASILAGPCARRTYVDKMFARPGASISRPLITRDAALHIDRIDRET
jgi:hypothetical protein